MFSIGDFAQLGRVSVRMLRHYDAIGLLPPAHVDPATGYRTYHADQLGRLNRLVALKDLGFTLQQVGAILDEAVGADELRGMLRMRQSQLEEQIAADRSRLARVEARLRTIESETTVSIEPVLTSVPATRVAQVQVIAASYAPEDVGAVIGPLFPELERCMAAAGVEATGLSVTLYVPVPGGGEEVTIHTCLPVADDVDVVPGAEVVVLPALPTAATVVHHGSLAEADGVLQALARWIDAHGFRAEGLAREINLACPADDFDAWVTELQVPIAPVAAAAPVEAAR